ncbi:plasmid mobilization relaxosome protein MobC [Streptodolium elevatio]
MPPRPARINQLRVGVARDAKVNPRFSPSELAVVDEAIAVTGQSRSLLLASAAEALADADLADPDGTRARVRPGLRRPPAEAKREIAVPAQFTADGKRRVLEAAALSGRTPTWYVADAGLRAADHILRTARTADAGSAESALLPSAGPEPGQPIAPDADPAFSTAIPVSVRASAGEAFASGIADAVDRVRDAVVFAGLASASGTGTDLRRRLVEAVERLSFQLRKVGVNLNQVAHAVNTAGTAEHADQVLGRVDATAALVHDVLTGILDHDGACTACGHRGRPAVRRTPPSAANRIGTAARTGA